MTEEATARTPYADQRKNHILDRLLSNGRVDAIEVAESLGVTGETIRKDLIALERQGILRRVHGGAVPVQSLAFEPASGDSNRISIGEDPYRPGRPGASA